MWSRTALIAMRVSHVSKADSPLELRQGAEGLDEHVLRDAVGVGGIAEERVDEARDPFLVGDDEVLEGVHVARDDARQNLGLPVPPSGALVVAHEGRVSFIGMSSIPSGERQDGGECGSAHASWTLLDDAWFTRIRLRAARIALPGLHRLQGRRKALTSFQATIFRCRSRTATWSLSRSGLGRK